MAILLNLVKYHPLSGVLRPKHPTVVTTNNGTNKSCVSVHMCKHQLLDHAVPCTIIPESGSIPFLQFNSNSNSGNINSN